MMKTVSRHPNVVSLLGCCTIRQPLLMIMEFVGCGDLVSIRKIFNDYKLEIPFVCFISCNICVKYAESMRHVQQLLVASSVIINRRLMYSICPVIYSIMLINNNSSSFSHKYWVHSANIWICCIHREYIYKIYVHE